MRVLGVPLALTLALLSFVATYIPYFGNLDDADTTIEDAPPIPEAT